MNFMEIAENRQSSRSNDAAKEVETEKLDSILKEIHDAAYMDT